MNIFDRKDDVKTNTFDENVDFILENIKSAKEYLDEDSINKFKEIIILSQHIFLVGAGRSALVAKAFAMRLVHIGFRVYVVGETAVPPIREDDCLVAISGSGETNTIIAAAKIAKQRGSKVLGITSFPDSTLGQLSDSLIIVKGRIRDYNNDGNYMRDQIHGNYKTLTPLGTIFELSSLVFLDSIITDIMNEMR